VIDISQTDPVEAVHALTDGRGAPIVIEVAWAGVAISQAVEMADLGARVVLVGIPGEDDAFFTHSTARRKGVTLKLCRRMKHVYPRTIPLVADGRMDLEALVTHRFGLDGADKGFAINSDYTDDVIKVMINPNE
jgi:L-iditol 2-dehydrogenase